MSHYPHIEVCNQRARGNTGVVWELMNTGLVFQSIKTEILHICICIDQLVHMYFEIGVASSCVFFLSVGAFDAYWFYQVKYKTE